MSNYLNKKLLELNLKRRNEATSLANYSPYQIFNNIIFISGQLPLEKNKLKYVGKLYQDIDLHDLQEAVSLATLNLLWILSDYLNLNKEHKVKCINIKGYINCKENFEDHSLILNISSDLIIKVLGNEFGNHSRSVIGVNSLPKNSPIEIEATFGIIK
jgi:enamine deaminase RidA (YjgF/YER057c/UK114 family)